MNQSKEKSAKRIEDEVRGSSRGKNTRNRKGAQWPTKAVWAALQRLRRSLSAISMDITYLDLGIRVDIDDQDSLDGVSGGSHINVELLHDALGNLGLGDEEIIEQDAGNGTTDAVVDVGLDLASGILQGVEALVDLGGVDQVLYGDLKLTEGVVLGLSFDTDVERLQTQAYSTDDGGRATADAVET